jgi:hypothetical protein
MTADQSNNGPATGKDRDMHTAPQLPNNDLPRLPANIPAHEYDMVYFP